MLPMTTRAADLLKRANLAEKNVPVYARAMPGVSETLKICRETLALLVDMAASIEAKPPTKEKIKRLAAIAADIRGEK